jgi:hypothetical protein
MVGVMAAVASGHSGGGRETAAVRRATGTTCSSPALGDSEMISPLHPRGPKTARNGSRTQSLTSPVLKSVFQVLHPDTEMSNERPMSPMCRKLEQNRVPA